MKNALPIYRDAPAPLIRRVRKMAEEDAVWNRFQAFARVGRVLTVVVRSPDPATTSVDRCLSWATGLTGVPRTSKCVTLSY